MQINRTKKLSCMKQVVNDLFSVKGLLLLILIVLVLKDANKLDSMNLTEKDFLDSRVVADDQLEEKQQSITTWDPYLNPLGIPPGKAQNLPSIRQEDKQLDASRRRYGGKGDKAHLGGFSEIDTGGISPGLFKHMVQDYGVQSFLDIGCGRGFSTSWFAMHGVDAMCAEGSHDAIERTVIPDPQNQVVEHDFSRGPWWPEKTYDVAWSVEFLEHVNLQFQYNYVQAFRKAAIIMVSSSKGNGWHHVEIHNNDWWIKRYERYGFQYNEELTAQVKKWARETRHDYKSPSGKVYDGYYIWATIKVFINPVVASLPRHAHLFPEFGCWKGKAEDGKIMNRECDEKKNETPLDPSFYPLKLTPEMDEEWNKWVAKNVKQ